MDLLLIDPAARRVQRLHTGPDVPTTTLPPRVGEGAFYWLACERSELEAHLPALQALLQQLAGSTLVDLHVSDLLNAHIPSTYDYTSDYDVLVFRRLAMPHKAAVLTPPTAHPAIPNTPGADLALQTLQTAPVGYAVWDALLLSVHPVDCPVRTQSQDKLATFAGTTPTATAPDKRNTPQRLPTSSAELMLRHLHQMVDGYLNLRRDMGRRLDRWQAALLHPKSRFKDWPTVLQARLALHQLDEIGEDQRAAVQDWIDALDNWPTPPSPSAQRERELLRVRARDVLEHIERVLHHVRRMEQSAETAVQMHFSVQSNRANDIMRTLTTLTAIFLPLNLIAALFGMNFDVLPLVHKEDGFWWALGSMGAIGVALLLFFWRRRYLERDSLLGETPPKR